MLNDNNPSLAAHVIPRERILHVGQSLRRYYASLWARPERRPDRLLGLFDVPTCHSESGGVQEGRYSACCGGHRTCTSNL